MGCIRNPERANIPYEYQTYLLRDILGYTDDDILDMTVVDYRRALNYAWLTYTLRRPDYIIRKMFAKQKGDEDVEFDLPDDWDVDPTFFKKDFPKPRGK